MRVTRKTHFVVLGYMLSMFARKLDLRRQLSPLFANLGIPWLWLWCCVPRSCGDTGRLRRFIGELWTEEATKARLLGLGKLNRYSRSWNGFVKRTRESGVVILGRARKPKRSQRRTVFGNRDGSQQKSLSINDRQLLMYDDR